MEKKVSYEFSIEEILQKFGVNIEEINKLNATVNADVSNDSLILYYTVTID